jgi:hypothetical protein
VLVAVGQGPAQAEQVRVADRVGDAPARFDITAVDYSTGTSISVQVRVRNLRGAGTQVVSFFFTPRGADLSYTFSSVRRPDGAVSASLESFTPEGAEQQVPCSLTARWRTGADRILLRVPYECFAPAQTYPGFRGYLAIGRGDGSGGDPADWIRDVGVPNSFHFDP